MNKQNAATKIMPYKKDGFILKDTCKITGFKIGSTLCQRDCNLFHSHDIEKQIVTCYDPNKVLF